MSTRRRRHPNGRFWALLGALVVIAAAIVAATHHHRQPTAQPTHHPRIHPKVPTFSLSRWRSAPITLSQPVVGFAAAKTAHAIWLLGGLVNGQSTTLVQKLTWTAQGRLKAVQDITPGLPVALHDAAAAIRGNHLILLGGGSYVSSASVFSLPLPRLNPATTTNPLPIPLSDLAAVPDQSKILVVGGHDAGAPSDTIWSYAPGKPVTVWGHLPTGVRYPAVAADGSTLYVIGGLAASGPSDQAVAYNLQTGKMRRLPKYPVSIEHAEAAMVANHLVVAGGETNAGWIDAVYWYDAAKKVWKPGPSLPEPGGYGAFLTLPSGEGLWLGGQSPSGAMDVIWTIQGISKQ